MLGHECLIIENFQLFIIEELGQTDQILQYFFRRDEKKHRLMLYLARYLHSKQIIQTFMCLESCACRYCWLFISWVKGCSGECVCRGGVNVCSQRDSKLNYSWAAHTRCLLMIILKWLVCHSARYTPHSVMAVNAPLFVHKTRWPLWVRHICVSEQSAD